MSDFETHPRGTTEEIKLSRELMEQIAQTIESVGKGVFPANVIQAYNRLYGHHIKMLQSEQG